MLIQGGRSWQPFGEGKNGHKIFQRNVSKSGMWVTSHRQIGVLIGLLGCMRSLLCLRPWGSQMGIPDLYTFHPEFKKWKRNIDERFEFLSGDWPFFKRLRIVLYSNERNRENILHFTIFRWLKDLLQMVVHKSWPLCPRATEAISSADLFLQWASRFCVKW